ncbi:MAG TPA: FG-GAP-like repeat-containing protein [Candidatus Acidoferrales bacterium]|nr:FG-GAP-like repeat-containing protein [Candidatus Acidoferrales bacterium]
MPANRATRDKSAWALACLWLLFAVAVTAAYPQARSSTDSSSPAVTVKPDARKAKEAFRQGQEAENQQDWATAYEYYSQAAEYAPSDKNYVARRETAKAALVQSHVDAAERDAISNRLDDARRELVIASNLDPTNTTIRERLAEFLAAEQPSNAAAKLGGEPELGYSKGNQNFNYRGDTLGAYNEVARVFGVQASFDPELNSRPVRLVLNDVDFPTVMRILGVMTDTFSRPISGHMFFVAQDTPQKRRDFAEVAIRTVPLPASSTPAEMTETLRVVRDISGITRASLDTSSRTITLRASPQALAVASDVIDGIEQPLGEMVLEIEVLEVDRNFARQLGITPPQHLRAFTLTPSEIAEANSSAAGLVDVISKIFGLPTSLSGLSPTQIAGLLGSGNLNASSLIPPLIAFGGGQSTFLATMPSAVANFGRTLSLVHHGIRIFLRAEDGQPATAFFGEHYPVSLANYSSSLGGPQIPGISSSSFPSKNYQAGKAPQFVGTAVLRNGSAISDLVVANAQSGNVGVFLGNGTTTGDGTFADQVTYATDPLNPASNPVWIASASFDESNGFIDLAVANKASNNIGILLASAAGDGTFLPATTIPTGRSPVSVVAARFHDLDAANNHVDLAVANQGDNTILLFSGKGDGTFSTSPTVLQLPVGFQPAGLLAQDLNGDNHIDLVVADQGNNSVSVFLGNGDGTFQPRVDYATGNSPVYVATADFNSDGIMDLAVANNGASTATNSGDSITILLGQQNANGTASGKFAPGQTRDYPAGVAPTSLVVGDFNVDGLADLVVSDGDTAASGAAGDNAVSVLLGGGDGSFSSNFEIPVGTNPQSIVTGDFNDDSTLDIATANSGDNDVTVVLNSSAIFNPGTGANGSLGTPYPNVQYLDIGLKVKATPHIHADNEVTLALDFSNSSIAAQSFNQIPVLSNQSLTHTVRLKQDQTSVIANYLAPQTSVNVNGTPGIVGLPGLEWLAQNQSIADQNTEIIILVTPRMVRYAPRENREIYAGRGALEGAGAAPPPLPVQPAAPGEQPPVAVQPAAQAGQPGAPQPGQPTNAPAGQQPAQQTPNQQQPIGQPPAPGQQQANPNQPEPTTQQPQNPTQPQNQSPQTPPARPVIE